MFAGLPILMLSMHDESLYAEQALRAGAKGYLMKDEASETLIAALRRVAGGHNFISAKVADAMLRKAAGQRKRTPSFRGRKIAVLKGVYVSEGTANVPRRSA